jgi:hypothetical protein
MDQAKSFRDVVELWPSHVALASLLGLKTRAVAWWVQRDQIPPSHWPALLKVAAECGFDLTYRDLSDIHNAKRKDKANGDESGHGA